MICAVYKNFIHSFVHSFIKYADAVAVEDLDLNLK